MEPPFAGHAAGLFGQPAGRHRAGGLVDEIAGPVDGGRDVPCERQRTRRTPGVFRATVTLRASSAGTLRLQVTGAAANGTLQQGSLSLRLR